jgi:hypothetical protein
VTLITEVPAGDHRGGDEHPPTPAPSTPRPRRRRRIRWRWIAVVLAVLLAPVAWSYGSALAAGGNEPVTVRTSDWLRSHGFQSMVDRVEQWWYTRSPPKGDRPAPGAVAPGLSRAGVWVDVKGLATRPGAVQQTWVQPDAAHRSVVANIVRFDQTATRMMLVAGTKEPGGAGWPWKGKIPADQRAHAVAAFNAGFKFDQSRGGFYEYGRQSVRPLRRGIASLVVHSNGTATVAQWGRDAKLTHDVVAVRQNLALVVDGGRPARGLDSNRGAKWGTHRSQFQYTWRSGLGVDAQGRLVYVAGNHMTLAALAHSLIEGGAVRGMQLDIHDGVVSFNWYRPAADGHGTNASKLVSDMQRSANRYLVTDSRDFFTVLAR